MALKLKDGRRRKKKKEKKKKSKKKKTKKKHVSFEIFIKNYLKNVS